MPKCDGFIKTSQDLNLDDYKIYQTIQATKTLHEGFLDKLDSIQDQLISPT